MEQFSPNTSRIFGAAGFANIYSSALIVFLRLLVAVVLILLMVLFPAEAESKIFFFSLGTFLIFASFEIFYKGKILNEKPVSFVNNQNKNIAESFTLETARILLKANLNDPKSIFKSLLKNRKTLFVVEKTDVTTAEINELLTKDPWFTGAKINFIDILAQAVSWAQKEKRAYIDKLDILLAFFSNSEGLKKLLFQKGVKEPDLLNIIFWAREYFGRSGRPFWESPVDNLGPGISDVWTGGWTPQTERYAVDVTKEMRKQRSSFVLVGKDREIEQVEEVLSRSEKRNVILLGQPGIGKTTTIRGLAEKSMQGRLPPAIEYKRFLELDVTSLVAGAASGELEQRLQNLLTELSHAGNVVLFVPSIENLAGGSGTGVNITGHLITSLNSGKLQVIATSTRAAYRRFIEPQTTFSALFEPIKIEEPDTDQAIRVLEQAAPKIETKSKIVITYKALSKAVELSERYMVDRVLPGKAIDLLDEAATAISLNRKRLLEPADIEGVVSEKTKMPIAIAAGKEAEKLVNLEKVIHQRIIDQEEAVAAIAGALRRARSIERTGNKPIGSFLFLGPTGVGKTETAKAIASLYFGSEEEVIRIDMSEYQSQEAINRLIGAPPGTGKYEEGGEFTESVRQKPYCLILLDEIEKANPKILDSLLPILDDGVIEDVTGRKILFTNTIIIATSNAGAEYIRESVQQNIPMENLKKSLLEKLQREGVFKPEFLNRFDDIVVYKPLGPSEITSVIGLLISELSQRLKKQDIAVTVDPQAISWVAQNGYDPTYGARPLRRFIADNIESKIAEKILTGQIKRGSKVLVSIQNGQFIYTDQT